MGNNPLPSLQDPELILTSKVFSCTDRRTDQCTVTSVLAVHAHIEIYRT